MFLVLPHCLISIQPMEIILETVLDLLEEPLKPRTLPHVDLQFGSIKPGCPQLATPAATRLSNPNLSASNRPNRAHGDLPAWSAGVFPATTCTERIGARAAQHHVGSHAVWSRARWKVLGEERQSARPTPRSDQRSGEVRDESSKVRFEAWMAPMCDVMTPNQSMVVFTHSLFPHVTTMTWECRVNDLFEGFLLNISFLPRK